MNKTEQRYAKIIRLRMAGKAPEEIAESVGCCMATLYVVIKKAKEAGLIFPEVRRVRVDWSKIVKEINGAK